MSLSAVGIFLPGYYFSEKVKTAARQRHMPMAFVSPVAFIVFGTLGSVFAATTSLTELIYSLQQQLRLPPVFALGLMAAFHMDTYDS